ncbi:MAG TPA: hypothetical protein VGJ87_02330 [Roseiflexaceae bacterium]
MSENERQQRMVERIQEDERLRGDLEDAAATALVEWASERVAAAAADPARPDAEVDADVQAVRAAVRTAAHSGEGEPQRLIALAEAALAQDAGAARQPAQAAGMPSDVRAAPARRQAVSPPAEPAPGRAETSKRSEHQRASSHRRWSFTGLWSRFRRER